MDLEDKEIHSSEGLAVLGSVPATQKKKKITLQEGIAELTHKSPSTGSIWPERHLSRAPSRKPPHWLSVATEAGLWLSECPR